ncbi:XRE family transcriptional regulator [Alloscardovia omnicolens]
MAEKYMSYSEVAAYLNVATGALGNYKLPEPDAYIGRTRGWKKQTIEIWNANRPGKGNRRGR